MLNYKQFYRARYHKVKNYRETCEQSFNDFIPEEVLFYFVQAVRNSSRKTAEIFKEIFNEIFARISLLIMKRKQPLRMFMLVMDEILSL